MYDRNLKQLKELSTIVRIPTLTQELQKIWRSRENEKERQDKKMQAIKEMSQKLNNDHKVS